ncbi:hypothetical protein Q5752_005589 [Cryptotrichosporon argae]
MSSVRDYTDSETDSDDVPVSAVHTRHPSVDAELEDALDVKPLSPKAAVRIKLRHNEPAVPAHLTHIASSDRSSLSPPPPIKLRLGLKPPSMSTKASFSSDSDSAALPTSAAVSPKKRKPTSKRKNTGAAVGASAGAGAGVGAPGPSMPAQHRKTYDWLQPGSASASHTGPPEREKERKKSTGGPGSAGTSADARSVDDELLEASGGGPPSVGSGGTPTGDGKKKRKKTSEPGPGKNWRKGIKKGDPLPWKETTPLFSEPKLPRPSPLAASHSASNEATPEPLPLPHYTNAEQLARADLLAAQSPPPREPTPPFVLADPVKLGFPVFTKPIVAPKITLGPFPKVTAFFAPFDNKPFRKERVRTWTQAEKTVAGIGGSQLRFRTWRRGPQSELGRVLAAQKEADAQAARARKAADREEQQATARPPLLSAVSSESGVPTLGMLAADDEDASEVGDDESVAGSARGGGGAGGGGKSANKRARPRKSKLAHEIIVEPASAEAMDVDAAK